MQMALEKLALLAMRANCRLARCWSTKMLCNAWRESDHSQYRPRYHAGECCAMRRDCWAITVVTPRCTFRSSRALYGLSSGSRSRVVSWRDDPRVAPFVPASKFSPARNSTIESRDFWRSRRGIRRSTANLLRVARWFPSLFAAVRSLVHI
jgi:hypothetical protein